MDVMVPIFLCMHAIDTIHMHSWSFMVHKVTLDVMVVCIVANMVFVTWAMSSNECNMVLIT
jgi:hypothetical protein